MLLNFSIATQIKIQMHIKTRKGCWCGSMKMVNIADTAANKFPHSSGHIIRSLSGFLSEMIS